MLNDRMTDGRHPHEVLVCAAALLTGSSGLLLQRSISPTIEDALGGLSIWYFFGLVLASVVALIGIWLPRIEGPLLERVGLGVLAAFFAGYGVAILFRVGPTGIASSLLPMAFAMANVLRMRQISRSLADLRNAPNVMQRRRDDR